MIHRTASCIAATVVLFVGSNTSAQLADCEPGRGGGGESCGHVVASYYDPSGRFGVWPIPQDDSDVFVEVGCIADRRGFLDTWVPAFNGVMICDIPCRITDGWVYYRLTFRGSRLVEGAFDKSGPFIHPVPWTPEALSKVLVPYPVTGDVAPYPDGFLYNAETGAGDEYTLTGDRSSLVFISSEVASGALTPTHETYRFARGLNLAVLPTITVDYLDGPLMDLEPVVVAPLGNGSRWEGDLRLYWGDYVGPFSNANGHFWLGETIPEGRVRITAQLPGFNDASVVVNVANQNQYFRTLLFKHPSAAYQPTRCQGLVAASQRAACTVLFGEEAIPGPCVEDHADPNGDLVQDAGDLVELIFRIPPE